MCRESKYLTKSSTLAKSATIYDLTPSNHLHTGDGIWEKGKAEGDDRNIGNGEFRGEISTKFVQPNIYLTLKAKSKHVCKYFKYLFM